MPLEQRREPRHAFARAAQGIDIDLEADARPIKHRVDNRAERQGRRGRRNRRSPSARRACRSWASSPSSAVVFLIEGRRAGMSA